jgi:hypothetical protein
MGKILLIKARVTNFSENSMHVNFRNQPCHFYDATLLEILEPPELAGEKLSIYHDKNNRIDSLWHQVDSILEFKINQDLLMQSDAIFTGAAQELHSCFS